MVLLLIVGLLMLSGRPDSLVAAKTIPIRNWYFPYTGRKTIDDARVGDILEFSWPNPEASSPVPPYDCQWDPSAGYDQKYQECNAAFTTAIIEWSGNDAAAVADAARCNAIQPYGSTAAIECWSSLGSQVADQTVYEHPTGTCDMTTAPPLSPVLIGPTGGNTAGPVLYEIPSIGIGVIEELFFTNNVAAECQVPGTPVNDPTNLNLVVRVFPSLTSPPTKQPTRSPTRQPSEAEIFKIPNWSSPYTGPRKLTVREGDVLEFDWPIALAQTVYEHPTGTCDPTGKVLIGPTADNPPYGPLFYDTTFVAREVLFFTNDVLTDCQATGTTLEATGNLNLIVTILPSLTTSPPTKQPTKQPSRKPTRQPTNEPSRKPTRQPTRSPAGSGGK